MWIGNLGVVPLFCSLRLRALPLRAWRILRAVLVFIMRDGMLISWKYLRFKDLLG
jgi:hypothetical protein